MDRSHTNINGSKLQSLIEKGNIFIIDVRTTKEYNNGHIPGAINIPLENLQNKLNDLSVYINSEIIVYCKGGTRSSKAAAILFNNGFNNVYNLSGGILSYKGNLVK